MVDVLRGPHPRAAESAVLDRSRRRIAAQVALAMTVLIFLAGGSAYLVMVHGQHQEAQRELTFSAQRGDPKQQADCTYVYILRDGVLSTPPSAPAGLPLQAALRSVAATGRPVQSQVHRNGTVYQVRTQWRGNELVQAAFDDRDQRADRRQLLIGLAAAETVGLLTALGTGAAVGRRTIAPLTEALNRQRRFVTDASHELRTPIAQVHTRAQLLARQARSGSLPAEHQAELGRLIVTTRQLGEIVDELLLSTQLATAPPKARPVDLGEITAAAVAAESPRAITREIEIRLDRPGGPLCVTGVESALRRVVTSLLDNSIAHTPPGGRISIALQFDPIGPIAQLTVADTGVGFDPADAERIFDRFYRGSNGSGRRFGLGLALVREVVTSHGGTVRAGGRPGQGAQFIVRLPSSR